MHVLCLLYACMPIIIAKCFALEPLYFVYCLCCAIYDEHESDRPINYITLHTLQALSFCRAASGFTDLVTRWFTPVLALYSVQYSTCTVGLTCCIVASLRWSKNSIASINLFYCTQVDSVGQSGSNIIWLPSKWAYTEFGGRHAAWATH